VKRLKFALFLAIRVVAALLFVFALVKQAHADGDFGYPAFWPGKELIRFLASSEYSSCENISHPTFTDNVDRLEFDSHDNLWMTGTNMGLVKELSSERYMHFESFGFSQISGFIFDPSGNMWIAEPRSTSEMVHIPNLTELIGSTSYTNRFETEVPGIAPVDIASDAIGNLWIPSDWRQAYQVLKLAKGQSYANPIRFITDLQIRRFLVGRSGAMFAIVNSPNRIGLQVVEMKLEESALRKIRTIADMHGDASITLDGKGNLWALQQSWMGGPNQVVELLGSSGY
jgi:streptogramin lyase